MIVVQMDLDGVVTIRHYRRTQHRPSPGHPPIAPEWPPGFRSRSGAGEGDDAKLLAGDGFGAC